MASNVRRRRFTILIIMCCISLVIISWYSNKHCERTFQSKTIINFHEQSKSNDQERSLNERKITMENKRSEGSEIPTRFTESIKSELFLNHTFKQKREKMLDIYDGDYEFVFEEHDNNSALSTFFKNISILENKTFALREDDEIPFRMALRNHPEINNYGVLKNSNADVKDCIDCETNAEPTIASRIEMAQPEKNPSLIIDTPGCKIPKLNPWDPSVAHLIEHFDPFECAGPPLFMTANPDGSISLNETVLFKYYNMTVNELLCNYQVIYREKEEPIFRNEVLFTFGNVTKLQFGVPLNEDYVGVACGIKNKTKNFEQYFPLTGLKRKVEEERNAKNPPKPQLNVILAGIDSVSKLNFLRHFRKTLSYLNDKMSAFEMNGYTKVGDNTFPNLVPLLTGHFVEHYWNESLKDSMFFDDIDFIWKKYAERGYRTFFAEDSPLTGTFNYFKRGFKNPPTDYYFRPLALALEQSPLMRNKTGFCIHSQIETDVIYDYLRNFLKAMDGKPHFAFAMVSTLTHDFLNYAGWADEPTVNLLEDLSNMGALNNSLLVLFSDHGIRFGDIRFTYIGKYEERMPFMYVHVPNWFLEQYPEFSKNLKSNQDRLMTLFDIHATMVHLLDLNKSHEERSGITLGTSLFDEIPANRTCDDAHIKRHWCPCQTFDVISVHTIEANNAAQAIVDDINTQLKPFSGICEVLKVDTIMSVMVGKANDVVLRYLRAESEVLNKRVILGKKIQPIADYMVTLVTAPGGAVFEGTVRFDPEYATFAVVGISRINMYGNSSWCIDSSKLKLFCYCKIQKTD